MLKVAQLALLITVLSLPAYEIEYTELGKKLLSTEMESKEFSELMCLTIEIANQACKQNISLETTVPLLSFQLKLPLNVTTEFTSSSLLNISNNEYLELIVKSILGKFIFRKKIEEQAKMVLNDTLNIESDKEARRNRRKAYKVGNLHTYLDEPLVCNADMSSLIPKENELNSSNKKKIVFDFPLPEGDDQLYNHFMLSDALYLYMKYKLGI